LDAGSDPVEVLGHEIAEDEEEQVLLAELPLLLPLPTVKAAE
jgi:hypothetical protein